MRIPTLEERFGTQTGKELRELLDLQPASVYFEAGLFKGLDGIVQVAGGPERTTKEVVDVVRAAFEKNVRLMRIFKRIGREKATEAATEFLTDLFGG